MIKEIADILELDVGAISPADDSIFSEDKGVYYVKDKVKIDSDIFEKFLKLKELKLLCFQESVIFENCVFDKENLKKIQLKYTPNPEFKNCVFKNVDLNSAEFPNYGKNRSFLNCEFENIDNFLKFASKNTFKECVYESDFVYNIRIDEDKFLPKIEIKNWTFKGKVDFKNITCNKEISFENINFDGKIDFSKSTFEKKVSFKKCKFNELSGDDFFDFSEIDFKDNVYFDDSYFNEFAAFHLCVFEKTASFYSTKFKVIPNFSPGDFKGILNINNATWGENGNIEFEDVENIVDKACGKSETEKEKLETEKKLQTIRNIKDSFRAIKNVFMQENDQLEAQKFHKAELYCKELELEKENKNFSTIVDSLLLKCYRITSDHHTNFLKILNFTVFCIAVYAVCSFVFVDIYTATFFGESIIFSKNISGYVFLGLTLVLIVSTIIVIWYILKYYKYTHKSLIWIILVVIFIFVTSFIKPYYPNFARCLLLILVIMLLLLPLYFYNNEHKGIILFALLFFCFFTIPALSSIVYFFSDKNKNYDLLFKITIPAMISIYFCLAIFFSYLLEEKYLRKRKYKNLILLVFKSLVWGIVAFVLYLQPQLINPFVGVFKSDEILPKNYFEKKLNDLNASEIIRISNLLKNSTYSNLTEMHKKIIDSNTTTNTEIINAKELIKQNLKEINIANKELNTTINDPNELNATVITVNNLNNLIEKKDLQEYLVNGIKSSSLVYSIILLLCLYSLTKTARKNSIVPI
ncbi:MAG: pentapeptide repeat-containing protein [Campylobacteraceae bacterium]|nr:pentapeptide repeat-containing protein [Campylobacteraceae bacterium]